MWLRLCALLALLSGTLAVSHIWQITDIHVDDDYVATGTRDGMCRPESRSQGPEQWWGQLGCGLPWRTVQSAVDFMRDTMAKPVAVLWTGDTAPWWRYPDWTHVFPKLRRVSSMLRTAFPDAMILPVIGNHDAYPSDQFPTDNDTFYHAYLEQSGWGELLPEAAQRTFRRGGYYAVNVPGGYRVIVLNTALYYQKNRRLRYADDDPTGQLGWLADQLADNSRPTIVSGHISPGFPHWSVHQTSLQSDANYQLVRTLRSVPLERRVAHIFGHEHIDTFQNVYREDLPFEKHTHALNTYFIAPALMPGVWDQHVNPSVRVYALVNDKLNDYVQFHMDLDSANRAHRYDRDVSSKAFWKTTYRAREAYGLPDLTTRSMHLLFKEMKEKDDTFRKYWSYTGGNLDQVPPCNETCKRERLCVMSNQVYTTMQDCLNGGGQMMAPLGLVLVAGLVARILG